MGYGSAMRRHLLSCTAVVALAACSARPLGTPGVDDQPLRAQPAASCAQAPTAPGGDALVVSPEGWVVHWTLAPGCVAVRFDRSLGAFAEALTSAAAAWDEIACNRLCLQPPVETDDPDALDATRTIGLSADPAPDPTGLSRTTLTYDAATGRLRNVRVLLDTTAPLDEENLFLVLGKALGLDGLYFSTHFPSDRFDFHPLVQPMKDAICTLYGDPSRCGE